MIQIWLLLVIAVISLQYDSSREPALLLHNAQQQFDSDANWALLLTVGTEAQSRLALAALSESDSIYWLTIAAKANNANAQYRLAARQTDPLSAQFWLVKAAHNGVVAAQQELYQQFKQSDPPRALAWLTKAAAHNASSALILAEQKWQQGDTPQTVHFLNQAQRLGSDKARAYLTAFNNKDRIVLAAHSNQGCQQNIMLVVTTLDGLLQAQQFKTEYQQDARFTAMPICLGITKFLTQKELNCAANWAGTQRLGCDENQLAERLKDDDFSHLVVFANQGKANVKNGIMYLDRQDTYLVFVHELAHFAGFVDEYPLSQSLAKQFCYSNNQLPNVLIGKNLEDINLPVYWHIDKSQLVVARTCDNSEFQAYKPIANFTFMEYYDEGVMPALYLALWRRQLSDPSNMLPAYINLANAAENSGNKALQQYWWQRYKDFH